jgi:hypothetical protein
MLCLDMNMIQIDNLAYLNTWLIMTNIGCSSDKDIVIQSLLRGAKPCVLRTVITYKMLIIFRLSL